jgi:hypothetical protein
MTESWKLRDFTVNNETIDDKFTKVSWVHQETIVGIF